MYRNASDESTVMTEGEKSNNEDIEIAQSHELNTVEFINEETQGLLANDAPQPIIIKNHAEPNLESKSKLFKTGEGREIGGLTRSNDGLAEAESLICGDFNKNGGNGRIDAVETDGEEIADEFGEGETSDEQPEEEIKLLNGITNAFSICKFGSEHVLSNDGSQGADDNVSSDNKAKIEHEVKTKTTKTSKKRRALSFVDSFISIFVVGPLVVGHWRGIWNLMDLNSEMFPGWGCFALGTGVHVLFAILQSQFNDTFSKELKFENIFIRLGYRLVRLIYTYIFGAACNMQWRGGWIILTDCTVYTWVLECTALVCLIALTGLRSVRNLLAPPYIVVIDKRGRVFRFPTRFQVSTSDWSLYILDCAFSVGVVGTLIVFVWRGVWVFCDLYVFPDNPEYSAVGSLVIGYAVVGITYSIQPIIRYACARLKGLPLLVVADVFLLISFLGTVNVWRGIWNVLDLWLLPDNLELSCWISHVGCFVFLVLLNCSNSILVRGVYIDAKEGSGKCVLFPCHYLRLFFKVERERNETRRQNTVGASRDVASLADTNGKEVENSNFLTPNEATRLPNIPESLV